MVRLAEEASTIDDAGVAIRSLLLGEMEKRAADRGFDAMLTGGRSARFAAELGEKFDPQPH